MKGADIVTEARSWLGVRWKHQGRDREGIDCVGLPGEIGRAKGLIDFDIRDYLRFATDEQMLEECSAHLTRVSDPKPGDLGILRYEGTRHMVIFGDYPGGGLSAIHAYSRAPRRVVEHRFDAGWLASEGAVWLASFRFPGVDE